MHLAGLNVLSDGVPLLGHNQSQLFAGHLQQPAAGGLQLPVVQADLPLVVSASNADGGVELLPGQSCGSRGTCGEMNYCYGSTELTLHCIGCRIFSLELMEHE